MTDDIRNILDPANTLSDEDVKGLLAHAQKKKGNVWDLVLYMHRHNQLALALDWLREQGDKKLCRLADVLPRLFKQLEEKPAAPMVSLAVNKNEKDVKQDYHSNSGTTVINM